MRYGIAALIIFVGSCASAGKPSKTRGEILVQIESSTAIGYVEFIRPDTGDAVRVSAIPAGKSEHMVKVRAGTWCFRELSLGMGAVGQGLRTENGRCVEVAAGETVPWGRIALDGQNMNFFALPRAEPRR